MGLLMRFVTEERKYSNVNDNNCRSKDRVHFRENVKKGKTGVERGRGLF